MYSVNNGVPVRAGVAIDGAVRSTMMKALRRIDKPTKRWASLAQTYECIRSALQLFDTGANGSLNHRDVEKYLLNAVKSSITVADGNVMQGCCDGKLNCMLVNTANHEGFS